MYSPNIVRPVSTFAARTSVWLFPNLIPEGRFVKETIEFLTAESYAVLFVWVLGVQIGLPVPVTPALLVAGALAGNGKLSWTAALAVSVIAVLVADNLWYQFGKRDGAKVLKLLCRMALEPDSCMRQTEDVFQKYGVRTLLIAKFIPGVNLAASPVMGMLGLNRRRFFLYDALGALLWAGAYLGAGYAFRSQLQSVADYAMRFGTSIMVILLAGLAAFIGLKWRERQRFMKSLVVDRIEPDELKAKVDAGVPVVIVDLRHALDSLPEPRTLPGALRMEPGQLETRYKDIPKDSEIILYCT